ncbi:MAG: BamA/TamA family outer membrane protein [Bacteroidetes bacterium]|nr:BamA/TamA family outer membrane protein [Bacteroidota bacterium]
MFQERLKIAFILFLVLQTGMYLHSQESFTLEIRYSYMQESRLPSLRYESSFASIEWRDHETGKALSFLYGQGFPEAYIDSSNYDSTHQTIWINPGPRYQFTGLRPGNADPEILRGAGYRKSMNYRNTIFNYNNLSSFLEKILIYLENHGYPFATVKLDSISINHGEISAALNIDRNIPVSIDSIHIKGDARITRNYIYQYLGIKPGDAYNESRIRKIGSRINSIPFISNLSPHEVAFTPEAASLYLYLGKKKASQFDGIIGLAPNDKTSGKLLLTGDVKLKLINIIGKGELIDINWKKLEESSQDLRLHFNIPYLFKTPFGLDYQFQLYKKDTSYIRLNNNIGIQYLFYGNNYIKAYYEAGNSSLISTYGLEFATTLPPWADVKTGYYGLEASTENLDYRFNPRSGYTILVSGAAGNKNIRKNDAINPVLYDNMDLSGTQYKTYLRMSGFIPLARKFTVMASTEGAWLSGDNLFENELFRFGGLKTLRGFDEESLSANIYNILTAEVRYLFERNSYVSLFWNGAYYEKTTHEEDIIDRPYGFGAGLSFATRAGIFSVSYALGKEFNNPIDLKSAKIHFGITAAF